MNMQQQLNQYIDRIYRAVLQPESITDIMNDLRQVVDAPYTAFQIEHLYTHELSQASLIAYDDSAINQYSDYFVHVDPWTKRALEQGLLNQNFLASASCQTKNIAPLSSIRTGGENTAFAMQWAPALRSTISISLN